MSVSNIKLSTLRHKLVLGMLQLAAVDKSNYNQSTFPQLVTGGVCSTVFCAAGFLALAKSPVYFKKRCKEMARLAYAGRYGNFATSNYILDSVSAWEFWAVSSADLLKMDHNVAAQYFDMPFNWPPKFAKQYIDARGKTTEKGRTNARYAAFKALWLNWLKKTDKELGVKWVNGICLEGPHAVQK